MTATLYVTFGLQYAREPHPAWTPAHPDGWLRVVADTEAHARSVAFEVTRGRHATDYSPERFKPEYHPAGETHVVYTTPPQTAVEARRRAQELLDVAARLDGDPHVIAHAPGLDEVLAPYVPPFVAAPNGGRE